MKVAVDVPSYEIPSPDEFSTPDGIRVREWDVTTPSARWQAPRVVVHTDRGYLGVRLYRGGVFMDLSPDDTRDLMAALSVADGLTKTILDA